MHNHQNPRAYLNLGLALAEEGDHVGAVREYCRALEVKPKFYIAASELGHELVGMRQMELADKFYSHQNETPERVVGGRIGCWGI